MAAENVTTEMQQLNPAGLEDMIRVSFKQDRALMIWGEPGLGKSDIVKSVTESMNGKLIAIHLSQYDSVDLRGIPSVESVNKGFSLTAWNPNKTFPFKGNPRFSKDDLHVVFLDELPQAMHAVQAPAMQLVLEHKLGEHELMDNVRVIAAGNLEAHKSGSHSMLAALRNRFRHVQLQTSLEDWCNWAMGAGINPKLIAFLRFKPENLTTFQNAGGTVTSSKAFATPRTWECVSRTLDDASISEAMRLQLNTGDVGPGPAAELNGFLSLFEKMPRIEDLFANASSADVPTKNVGMMYAISTAISVHCKDSKLLKKITPYIVRMPTEYGVRTISDTLLRYPDVANSKEFGEFAELHQDLFVTR